MLWDQEWMKNDEKIRLALLTLPAFYQLRYNSDPSYWERDMKEDNDNIKTFCSMT